MALTRVTTHTIKDGTIQNTDISASFVAGISGSFTADMTLATASIAAITASVSTINSNMTLATASIAAITASVSTLKGNVGQELNTDSAVTFATVDTGQGANELYDMDQNVKTDSSPTFAAATITGTLTATEVHTQFVSASITKTTGSNVFGDAADDTHQFTGSVIMSSSITAVTGSFGKLVGEGGAITGLTSTIGGLDDAVTTATSNIGLGSTALDSISGGDNNVAVGINSGTAVTSGNDNVFIGFEAGDTTTDVDNAIIIGSGAGGANLTAAADGTVLIGCSAGAALTSGAHNLAIGSGSLLEHTTGVRNLAIGNGAMNATQAGGTQSTSAGSGDNVFIGFDSGGGNWTDVVSSHNTCVGNYTMEKNLDGALNNVAVGFNALGAVTTGDNNVCVGKSAAAALATGADNTFLGTGAGSEHLSGARNMAIGSGAMDGTQAGGTQTNSGGSNDNIFIGYNAGGGAWADATCGDNVAVGNYTMDLGAMDAGNGNTTVGHGTLRKITTGDYNASFGSAAGNEITTGAYNTCVGYAAGDTAVDGNSNTIVGDRCDVYSSDSGEALVFGQGECIAHADGSYMTIGMGNGSDRWWISYGSGTTWARESDERIKKNIQNSILGLDFVNDLRPVKFQYRTGEEQPEEIQRYNADGELQTPLDTESINYGMIAQEVSSSLNKAGVDDFPGWSVHPDTEIQALSVSTFVIPLIKAVQELTTKVEEQSKRIKELEEG
jgi:hypothetical protein